MAKKSAGILLFRTTEAELEVLLAHPGGPFFKNKDAGSWTIPKGECLSGEEPLAAAKREFSEETGFSVDGEFIALGHVKQAGGKIVLAWALQHDLDPEAIHSNTFEMEWPPKSGRFEPFPEVDRAGWFTMEGARVKILAAQAPFLDRLMSEISSRDVLS